MWKELCQEQGGVCVTPLHNGRRWVICPVVVLHEVLHGGAGEGAGSGAPRRAPHDLAL